MSISLKEKFIAYCLEHDYHYECGYNWCDCVDYVDFVNAQINDKWHTLYCLNSGGYRFDHNIVSEMKEIEEALNNGV